MTKVVAFLAQAPGSASIEDQKALLGPGDLIVVAGKKSFAKLPDYMAQNGMALEAGDHVKIHDLSCLLLETTTLVRAMIKLLDAGISIEIIKPGIVISPNRDDQGRALLEALSGHNRHIHGIKTHPADAAPQGRKRLLDPERVSEIRAMLEQPGATSSSVAKELGVARSTLFNYLDRFGRGR